MSPPVRMKKRKAMIENSTMEAPRASRLKDRRSMSIVSVANHALLMKGVDGQRRRHPQHRKQAEPRIGGAGRNPHDLDRIGAAIGASAGARVDWVGDRADTHCDVADVPPGHALRAATDLTVDRQLLARCFRSDRIVPPRQIPCRVAQPGGDHVMAVKSAAKLEGAEAEKDEERQHNRELDQRRTLSVGAEPFHPQEKLPHHDSPPSHRYS